MICLGCSQILFAMDNLLIQFNPKDYSIQFNQEDEEVECEECGEEIVQHDYYFEDESEKEDVELDLSDRLADEIAKHIHSCPDCRHGLDMKDLQVSLYVNFKEDNEGEELFDKFHAYTTLENLIADLTIVDECYYDNIIESLRCPHCGNGGGAYSKDTMYDIKFDKYTEVYTESEVITFNHDFYGETFEEIKQYVKLIDETIAIEKLLEFREEYVTNPVFIHQHEVFALLYKKLEQLYRNGQFLRLYCSKRMYRVQTNDFGQNLYSEERMWNAPNYLSSQGRYNTHGQSVLYCSNSESVLMKEVPLGLNQEYNLAEFRVIKPLGLIPIDTVFEDFGEFINDNGAYRGHMSKKYVLTNIIEMICKRIGYNGAAYKSVKDGRYVNYVFFNFEKNVDIELIKIYKIV